MNAKKCKTLRRLAKFDCNDKTTTIYAEKQHRNKTTTRVLENCYRRNYHILKGECSKHD